MDREKASQSMETPGTTIPLQDLPMLGIPWKQSLEVDWTTPIKDHLMSSYGQSLPGISESCMTLQKLSDAVRASPCDPGAPDAKNYRAKRDAIYRYYGQLEMLDMHFAVDEGHVKMIFSWFDAYTKEQVAQCSLAFEKASMLFNLASIISMDALNQVRSEDASQKSAYASFQAAAGILTYLNENFLHAPSNDLNRENVSTLINLMLAQALEVFYDRSRKRSISSKILANMAAQLRDLYHDSLEGMQHALPGIFDAASIAIVQVKMHYFSSTAQFHQALVDVTKLAYGSAVTRTAIAESEATKALKSIASFTSPQSLLLVPDTVDAIKATTKQVVANIQQKRTTIERENDFIHHDMPVSEDVLEPITSHANAMVKATPIRELHEAHEVQKLVGKDLFAQVIPLEITQSASIYEEEKAKLVRRQMEKSHDSDSETKASIQSMEISDIFARLREHEFTADTAELQSWCREVGDRWPSMSQSFARQVKGLRQSEEILQQCKTDLLQEETTCETMRHKWGQRWSQRPSPQVSKHIHNAISDAQIRLSDMQSAITLSSSSIDSVKPQLDAMQRAAHQQTSQRAFGFDWKSLIVKGSAAHSHGNQEHISDCTQGLDSLLDESIALDASSLEDQIQAIENLMSKIDLIRKDRDHVFAKLQTKIREDDISHSLLIAKKSGQSALSDVVQNELSKYEPYRERLQRSCSAQKDMCGSIATAFAAFLKDSRVQREISQRDRQMQSWTEVLAVSKHAYNSLNKLDKELDGIDRIKERVEGMLSSLEEEVAVFIRARRSEGASILSALT